MIRACLYTIVVLLAVPPKVGTQAVPAGRAAPPVVRVDYVIGPEDVLDIAIWNNTTISRTVPVRPDGMISLPLLNDIPAAGRTPLQLREDLMQRLTEYMPSPEVSVIVREVHSLKVSVIGSVRKPGRFDLKTGSTVLDLLAAAEGMNEFATPSRIVVLRSENGMTRRLRFNYKQVTTGAGQDNFLLRPGDIIVVP
ncbi:MAG TPA: polysaccharide biosynthesis/export family protein [Candidatus Polarisedimenticolia bacterium]|nr:polysaccharide biosynthesis/export family protein [Candidatus Polarisedimenticolia bacterium]